MAKRMLIDATHSEETRVAVLNNNRLEAFDFETSTKKQIKGNIYLAKVTRVEPSLQAAFVDYGGNRHGFLAFSEIHPDYYRIPVSDRQAMVREQRAQHAREDAEIETLYGELDDPDRIGRPDYPQSELDEPEPEESARDVSYEDEEATEDGQPFHTAEPAEASDDLGVLGSAEGGDVLHGGFQTSGSADEQTIDVADAHLGLPDSVLSGPQPRPDIDDPESAGEGETETLPSGTDEGAGDTEAVPSVDPDGGSESDGVPAETDQPSLPSETENAGLASRAMAQPDTAHPEGVETTGAEARPEQYASARISEGAGGGAVTVTETRGDTDEPKFLGADSAPSSSEPTVVADAALQYGQAPSDEEFAAELADEALEDDDRMPDGDTDAYGYGNGESDITQGPDGVEQNGFDVAVFEDDEEQTVETVGGDELEVEEVSRVRPRSLRSYKIQEVIKRRQILLVQVTKEERGNKGAALTTYLSLAGRYCVLMPNTDRGGGVSRKITSIADRRRLKEVVSELEVPEGIGVIVRTAGSERSKVEIKRDYEYLLRLWDDIRELTLSSQAPALIHEESSLIKRAIRDLYSKDIGEILVDGEEGYRTARDFMRMLMPGQARQVQPYRDASVPLFNRFQVDTQIDAIHSPIAQLKSGGYIVINTTEALVAIDVNSGRSTKERNIEETATKTNLEAADEVARQLRLRDLAGLIVIDFIDMEDGRNRGAVERRLKEAMRVDRARIQLGRISPFGLLELSRQRLRPSILEASTQPCPHCNGTGTIRSTESTALVVLRAIEEEGIRLRSAEIAVAVPTSVALYVLNQKRHALSEIETRYRFSVAILCDDTLIPPAFRLERLSALSAEEAAAPRPALPRSGVPAPASPLDEDDEQEVEPEDFAGEGERTEVEGAGSVVEAKADSEAPRAETEDESGRRRRRRRRSRRPDPRESDATADSSRSDENGEVNGNFDAGDERNGESETAEDDRPPVQPNGAGDLHGDAGTVASTPGDEPEPALRPEDEEDGGARRRRGRRGGRRRLRRDEEGQVDGYGPATDFASDGRPYGGSPGEGSANLREEPDDGLPASEEELLPRERHSSDQSVGTAEAPAVTVIPLAQDVIEADEAESGRVQAADGHQGWSTSTPATEAAGSAGSVNEPNGKQPDSEPNAYTASSEDPQMSSAGQSFQSGADGEDGPLHHPEMEAPPRPAAPAIVPHLVTEPPANPRTGWWKRLLSS